MLTGKCKEDFEKWLKLNWDDDWVFLPSPVHPHILCDLVQHFDKMPLSCRYGPMVDFFDSVGVFVIVEKSHYGYIGSLEDNKQTTINNWTTKYYETRNEARQEAIKKAIEIYESRETEVSQ